MLTPPQSVGASKTPVLEAASAFISISNGLITMDVALVAACGILLRIPEKFSVDVMDWIVAIAALYLASLAIFLGYRFQIGVASEMATSLPLFGSIMRGLELQSLLSLFAASTLLGLTLDRFRRHHLASKTRKK